jgi:hypothetical protein
VASVITAGTGNVNSTINLTGGSLVISNTAGAPSAPLTTLNLGGGSLHLNVTGSVSVTNIVATAIAASASTTLMLDSIAGVAIGTAYPLISYTGIDPYANLGLGTFPAGYTGTLVDNAAAKLISMQFSNIPGQSPPVINDITTVNGNLVFSGTNGSASGTYYVLTSTNLALSVTNWTRIATNSFTTGGTFSVTNAINPAMPQQFYLISQ